MPLALGLLLAIKLSLLLCPFIDDAEVLAIFICCDCCDTGWFPGWVFGMPVVMIYVLAVRLSLLLCPFIDDAEVLAIFICDDT